MWFPPRATADRSLLAGLARLGPVPDWMLRTGIRHALRGHLERRLPRAVDEQAEATWRVIRQLDAAPIAPSAPDAATPPDDAPRAFVEMLLGRHLQGSCCLFDDEDSDLDAAEAAMLERTCVRAEIDDGMRVLELGCGWGALCLWAAQRFPASRVTAVSGSPRHKAYIDARAKARGIGNLEVITAEPTRFETDARFDRVVCIEMFQHVRNWRASMGAIARSLDTGGKFFLQAFCHRAVPVLPADDDTVTRLLLGRCLMPSVALAPALAWPLRVERVYHVSGWHYARTFEAWLDNLYRRGDDALGAHSGDGAPVPPRDDLGRWRLLLLAGAELFAWRGGNEWFVAQYRFRRP